MDKLKVYLAVVKKYQFWVLCGVMLLTTMVCWWLATSGLAEQCRNRKAQIDSDFRGTDGIKNAPKHPNQGVIEKVKEQHKLLKQGVLSAWEFLYAEQQKNNLFPKIFPKISGKDDPKQVEFEKQFENLHPRLDSILRQRYQTSVVKDYLPGLLKMIDIRRPAEGNVGRPPADAPPGARGGLRPQDSSNRDLSQEMIGVIDWNDADYGRLENRFIWRAVPSTMDVVLAQEDLWVYEALLRIIKSVNEGATSQTNASVKRIDAIEIGKDSLAAWKNSQESVFRSSRTGAAAGGAPPAAGGAMPGMGAGTGEQDLFIDRYVDEKAQPLPVEGEYPYAKHPYAGFKMMPIHMTFLMDQRSLPKLLVECANSNMLIEVRRVRILKTAFEPFDLDTQPTKPGPGNPALAAKRRPGMRLRAAAPPPGGSALPGTNIQGQDLIGEFDVPVDIYAIMYIYNPPDRQKLGMEAASADNATGPASSTPAKPAPPLRNPAAPPAIPGK